MKTKTKTVLAEAWKYCDDKDKSTEFMLQFMQDTARVDLDCVMSFLQKDEAWERLEKKNKLNK